MPGPGPPPKKVVPPPKFDTLDLADTSVFDFHRLQQFALAVFTEIEREMATVTAYQAERDQLLNFWTITSNQCRETLSELKDAVLEVEIKQDLLTQKLDTKKQGLMKQRFEESQEVMEWLKNKTAELAVQDSITLKKERQIWQDLQELKNRLTELEVDLRECITNSYFDQQDRAETNLKDILRERQFSLDRLAYEDKLMRDKLFEDCSQKHKEEHQIKNKIFKKMQKAIWTEQFQYSMDIRRMRKYNIDTIVKLKEKAEELVRHDEWQSRYAHRLSKEVTEELKQRVAGYKLAQELQMHLLGHAEPRCHEVQMLRAKQPIMKYDWNKAQFLSCYIDVGIETLEKNVKGLLRKFFRLQSLLYNNDINMMVKKVDHRLQNLYEQKLVLFNLLNDSDPKETARISMEKETGLKFRTKSLQSFWDNINLFRIESRAVMELLNRLAQITMTKTKLPENSCICLETPIKSSVEQGEENKE